MGVIEDRLQFKIEEVSRGAWESWTPSLQVLAYAQGNEFVNLKLGPTYKYYDLASLTKIIFTTSVLMQLVDLKKIKLSDRLHDTLNWWPHKKTKISQLLTHSAGNIWWKPFYKNISGKKRIKGRWEELRTVLEKLPLKDSNECIYSDIDFLLLAYFLERKMGQSLFEIWEAYCNKLKLGDLHFQKNNKLRYQSKKYAPTERCPWRKKLLQGEVHDDNAWALGGVATHAGLFGGIDGVGAWALHLRKALYSSKGSRLASQAVIKSFTARQTHFSKGDWGYGFMKPTQGKASCGEYFSTASFGHTGFTGTSYWMDPTRDLIIIILSHRVCPTRKNLKFNQLRPLIHDWIVQEQLKFK